MARLRRPRPRSSGRNKSRSRREIAPRGAAARGADGASAPSLPNLREIHALSVIFTHFLFRDFPDSLIIPTKRLGTQVAFVGSVDETNLAISEASEVADVAGVHAR